MSKTPIAVIGLGCRLPGGANSPDALWDLLSRGVDAIVDVPADRWDWRRFFSADPRTPGKAHVKQGGFLRENVFAFDAMFFGISPREAEVLDPQQRLLMEVTYEAFEDAGVRLEKVRNSRTGVFIGGFMLDNLVNQTNVLNLELADGFSPAAASQAILSNRLSYVFGLRGPSLTVDTACSASLVATHLACQSLWSNESEMAIVGGAHVMLRPEMFVLLSKGQFVSRQGRCMAYDERASGYVRSEGAVVAILKPLPRAMEDGDRVYAVILNTGVNQDGTTPGISFPSRQAQEVLLRELLDGAGIAPDWVQYWEAHGTGTQAGDVTEANAINTVLSQGRPTENPCLIGSVKTNLGHGEAAAGVTGLTKVALSLSRGRVPGNLHFEKPNPAIDFARMHIRVPTQMEEWPSYGSRRLAGVSSFGYGGTNAAALLEAPLSMPQRRTRRSRRKERARPWIVPLSAQNEQSLLALTGTYAAQTSEAGALAWEDLAFSLCTRRSHLKHRVTFLAAGAKELRAACADFAGGGRPEWMASGALSRDGPRPLVFVYTGMGPQWHAMGRQLLEHESVFREAAEECDRIFGALSGWSLLDELAKDEGTSRIAQTEVAQPANFLIQHALTRLLGSWGITADLLIGHSIGEVAAASASGALSTEDALLLAYHRSRLQQTLQGTGRMLAIEASEEEAPALLCDAPAVQIAAVNSPSSLTLAGDRDQLESIRQRLDEQERFAKLLSVEVPYHSSGMDVIEDAFKSAVASLRPSATSIPLYSTVTGGLSRGEELDAEYWWRNVRSSVRFADGIRAIVGEHGDCTFLEVGPHPVLRASLTQCLRAMESGSPCAQTLNRKTDELATLSQSVGTLFCLGHEPAWTDLIGTERCGEFVPLPHYPWQRDVRWRQSQRVREQLCGADRHPLLATRIDAATPTWTVEVRKEILPFLEDHVVAGSVVCPGAVYLEAALAGHRELRGTEACVLASVQFHNMLAVDPQRVTLMQVSIDSATNRFTVQSRHAGDEDTFTAHATGRVTTIPVEAERVDLAALRELCAIEKDVPDFYGQLEDMGLTYGPAFRTVERLWSDDNSTHVLARLKHREETSSAAGYLLHPTLLDGALQAMVTLVRNDGGAEATAVVPVSVHRAVFYGMRSATLYASGTVARSDGRHLCGDIVLFSEDGALVARFEEVRFMRIAETEAPAVERYYEPVWAQADVQELTERPGLASESWLVVGDGPSAVRVQQHFADRGIRHTLVSTGTISDGDVDSDAPRPTSGDSGRAPRAGANGAISHVLFLPGLDSRRVKPSLDRVSELVLHVRDLVESLRELVVNKAVPIYVPTCGAHVVVEGDRGEDLIAAPINALGRLAENEYGNVTFRGIDFAEPESFEAELLEEITSDSEESEVAYRDGVRWVRRLRRSQVGGREPAQQYAHGEACVELDTSRSGSLDNVEFRVSQRREPRDGEVEVRVHSTSLNLKDLLKVMGRFPPIAAEGTFCGNTVGMDFSGIVTRVGKNVEHLRVGDAATGVAAGAFRTYVTGAAHTVVRKPEGLSFEDATVSVAVGSAYHGLVEVARLKRGEKVLIHQAAGGVGLAAIEVARRIGAEIFATASSDKQEYVRSRGVQRVYSSRDLRFANEILRDTGGYGVDVVLSALPGDGMKQSLGLLAPYGRYVELGKQDIATDADLPLLAFNRNLVFASIDMDRILIDRPEYTRQLLENAMAGFGTGDYRPLPRKVFEPDEIREAFRHMLTGRHIGKVVVTFDGKAVHATSEASSLFCTNGTYLVTGGTKGFGLEVAKWIAREGGGALVLVSRSGAGSDDSKRAIAALEAQGTRVMAAAVDVGDEESVKELIDTIRDEMPRLRGIFHSAMVLEDKLLADLTAESLETVLYPKIQGLLSLHEHTRDVPLDMFVCFSSISALIGNPGQASYVVANAFMDAFAWHSRATGRACTSMNLGPLSEAGILTRRTDIEEMLKRHGMNMISTTEACLGIDSALRSSRPQLGVFEVDWRTLKNDQRAIEVATTFADLVPSGENGGGRLAVLREEMEGIEAEERGAWLANKVAHEVSRVLGIPVERIDRTERFARLGIDSLSAAELGSALRKEIGVEFSTVTLLNTASTSQLAAAIMAQMGPIQGSDPGEPGSTPQMAN